MPATDDALTKQIRKAMTAIDAIAAMEDVPGDQRRDDAIKRIVSHAMRAQGRVQTQRRERKKREATDATN